MFRNFPEVVEMCGKKFTAVLFAFSWYMPIIPCVVVTNVINVIFNFEKKERAI